MKISRYSKFHVSFDLVVAIELIHLCTKMVPFIKAFVESNLKFPHTTYFYQWYKWKLRAYLTSNYKTEQGLCDEWLITLMWNMDDCLHLIFTFLPLLFKWYSNQLDNLHKIIVPKIPNFPLSFSIKHITEYRHMWSNSLQQKIHLKIRIGGKNNYLPKDGRYLPDFICGKINTLPIKY